MNNLNYLKWLIAQVIIGSEASVLIHEVLVAMRVDDNGGTVDNIIKTVHIHPALSEVVARAAADIRRL